MHAIAVALVILTVFGVFCYHVSFIVERYIQHDVTEATARRSNETLLMPVVMLQVVSKDPDAAQPQFSATLDGNLLPLWAFDTSTKIT